MSRKYTVLVLKKSPPPQKMLSYTMMRKLDYTAGACTCALGMGGNSSYEMELAIGYKALIGDKQCLYP